MRGGETEIGGENVKDNVRIDGGGGGGAFGNTAIAAGNGGSGVVIRELIGGEWRDAGRVEVRWDGRDALGFPCEPGRAGPM